SRLLSPAGGELYANFVILADLNKKLVTNDDGSGDQQKEWYHSVNKQIDDWRQSLVDINNNENNNQLVIKEFSVSDDIWKMSRQEIIAFMPIL
ncbi:hypothetical protein, partial [Salmonella sp. s24813]|uniref:hypothetical protein n=1 Tax=Salmonella sp. s24813 TaxID=3159632 RepID=UPI00397F495E